MIAIIKVVVGCKHVRKVVLNTFGHVMWCRKCGSYRDVDGKWRAPESASLKTVADHPNMRPYEAV